MLRSFICGAYGISFQVLHCFYYDCFAHVIICYQHVLFAVHQRTWKSPCCIEIHGGFVLIRKCGITEQVVCFASIYVCTGCMDCFHYFLLCFDTVSFLDFDSIPCLGRRICPFMVAGESDTYRQTAVSVRLGHLTRCPCFITFRSVGFAGPNIHWWRYLILSRAEAIVCAILDVPPCTCCTSSLVRYSISSCVG